MGGRARAAFVATGAYPIFYHNPCIFCRKLTTLKIYLAALLGQNDLIYQGLNLCLRIMEFKN